VRQSGRPGLGAGVPRLQAGRPRGGFAVMFAMIGARAPLRLRARFSLSSLGLSNMCAAKAASEAARRIMTSISIC
jgi:hypothetical protein